MSQIRKSSLAMGLLPALVVFALAGCADNNPQATFDPVSGKHVSDAAWKVAGHKNAIIDATTKKIVEAKIESCKECHGSDLKGGISAANCTTQCHLDNFEKVHYAAWNDLTYTKHRDTTVTTKCANASCHGVDLKGVTGSGPSCTSCHLGGAASKHPTTWGAKGALAFYTGHKAYVESNGTASCANAKCHGTNLDGLGTATGPSCTSCHMGGIAKVHPTTVASWTAGHQFYRYSTSAKKLTVAETKAKCDNAVCHGTDRAAGGLIKTAKPAASCNTSGCHVGETY